MSRALFTLQSLDKFIAIQSVTLIIPSQQTQFLPHHL